MQQRIPDLNYIQQLPLAKTAEEVLSDTLQIRSSWVGSAVANQSTFSDEVSRNNYVIGVNGRGSLQITPGEFNELLSSMLGVARLRAGFEPTEK